MSNRLATRIGLLAADERAPDSRDIVRFHEPTVGALARTKGSLFLLAQVNGNAAVERAVREVLEALEHDYYYDLSVGVLGALAKALTNGNRRLYHARGRLGIPRRTSVSVVALAIRGREVHVAKLGPASAVIVRGNRMYELPPPPAVHEEDPRVRRRRIAATLGEALEIEPYTWSSELAADDRLALLSRNLAQTIGVEDLKSTLASMRPALAIEHLHQLFAMRGGNGSDGMLVIEIAELPATATTHHLEPVRPAEPLAGLPDQSPVPLADAIGRGLRGAAGAGGAARSAAGRGVLYLMSWILAFVPHRRPAYPRTIPRTALREEGRRRRIGFVGIAIVAGLVAVGATVGSLPSASPTDAIPRSSVARGAIAEAVDHLTQVAERVDGATLLDRDPETARELLNDAHTALGRAAGAGVPAAELTRLQARVDAGLDSLYRVTRLGAPPEVADLGAAFEDFAAARMVAASDGSLWVLDDGRGRVVRVDPNDGASEAIYRAGQAADAGVLGEPWLLATAATDVVVIDRQRQAWRIDLAERIPRRMTLNGVEALDAESGPLAALQHRPPLEIFTLYLVDGADGQIRKWTPPPVIPVEFPDPSEPYLTGAADLDPREARDLRADVNLWLLHASTVTRVDFGSPRPQADFSLDLPPDRELRPALEYQLLDGATVGDRDYLYVYDAAYARVIAFQRADGAFVRQWMADAADAAGLLDGLVGLSVASVPDGPPVAYLLSPERLVRVVLE